MFLRGGGANIQIDLDQRRSGNGLPLDFIYYYGLSIFDRLTSACYTEYVPAIPKSAKKRGDRSVADNDNGQELQLSGEHSRGRGPIRLGRRRAKPKPKPWDGVLLGPQEIEPRPHKLRKKTMPGHLDSVHAFAPTGPASWAGVDESSLPALFYDLWLECMKYGEYAGSNDTFMIESSGMRVFITLGAKSKARLAVDNLLETGETVSIRLANDVLVDWDKTISPKQVRQWLEGESTMRAAGLTGVVQILENEGRTLDIEFLRTLSLEELGNISYICRVLGPTRFLRAMKISDLKAIASLLRSELPAVAYEVDNME